MAKKGGVSKDLAGVIGLSGRGVTYMDTRVVQRRIGYTS